MPGAVELVVRGDAELAGEAVDLDAAAVVGAAGGQQDLGAVLGTGTAGWLAR
jgi:hypothetical protein